MLAPFLIYTWVKTTLALLVNPWLTRSIKTGGDYTKEMLSLGIAGYSLIYFLVALIPVLVYIILNSKDKIMKCFCLVLYTFAGITIISSNFFIALICFGISTVVAIFIYIFKSKNWIKLIVFVGIIAICLILIDEIYVIVSDFVSRLSRDGQTAYRLSMMEESFWEGLYIEFKEDRWPTILKSMEAFIERPILGFFTTDMRYTDIYAVMGGHSHVFDSLAIWGIVIGCLNVYIMFYPFNKACFKNGLSILSVPMLLTTIILFGFNNATNSISCIVYLLYPYICITDKKVD